MGELMNEIIEWASLKANAEGILGLDKLVQDTRMACDSYIELLKKNAIYLEDSKRIRTELAKRLKQAFIDNGLK